MLLYTQDKSSHKKMRIIVNRLNGKTTTLDVDPFDTIDSVKTKVLDEEGITTGQNHLIFNGKQLEDDRTFSSYNIHEESSLQLLLSFQGNSGD